MNNLYFVIALTLSLIGTALDISLRYTFFSYIFVYSYIYLFVSICLVCYYIDITFFFFLVSTDRLVKSHIFFKLV